MDGTITLSGTVTTGLGKGRYFMSAREYKEQFVGLLGIDPYHGTLNLRADAESLAKLAELKARNGIEVKGFIRDGRQFGGVKAFNASISGARCALIIPEKTAHADVFEIIASQNLRESLSLNDGDVVEVSVTLTS